MGYRCRLTENDLTSQPHCIVLGREVYATVTGGFTGCLKVMHPAGPRQFLRRQTLGRLRSEEVGCKLNPMPSCLLSLPPPPPLHPSPFPTSQYPKTRAPHPKLLWSFTRSNNKDGHAVCEPCHMQLDKGSMQMPFHSTPPGQQEQEHFIIFLAGVSPSAWLLCMQALILSGLTQDRKTAPGLASAVSISSHADLHTNDDLYTT